MFPYYIFVQENFLYLYAEQMLQTCKFALTLNLNPDLQYSIKVKG